MSNLSPFLSATKPLSIYLDSVRKKLGSVGNNSEGLAPFMSKVKGRFETLAIYRHSDNGPAFGDDLVIKAKISQSRARLGSFYSVPASVKDKLAILKGPGTYFSPDKVEVFYLDPSR